MAKRLGLTTSLDIQWDPAEQWDFNYKKILPFVDVFFPNEKEVLNLTKQNSIEKAINLLKDYGNVIVVKKGNKGSLMHYKKKVIACAPFLSGKVVDAIGAGDSFNAGFIFKYLHDYSERDCQRFGNLMGAVSTTKAGGTTAFLSFEETMKIAKEKFD